MHNNSTGTDMHRCKQLQDTLTDTVSHTQRVFPREIRERGYFRTLRRLNSLFPKEMQTLDQKTTLSCFLVETSSLC